MKNLLPALLSLTAIAPIFLLTSCCMQPDDYRPPAPLNDAAADQAIHASDGAIFSDALHETLHSAEYGLVSSGAARVESPVTIIVNAEVKLNHTKDILTVDFTGDNEDGTCTRSGKMYVYLTHKTKRWYTKGAQWKIDYGTGVTITRKADSKQVKMTGSATITNLTGGNLYGSTDAADSVAHQIDGQLSLTFDNETTAREWTTSRVRTVAKSGAAHKVTFTGNGADRSVSGNFDHIAEYGTNRFGHAFTATLDKPLVMQYCGGRYKFTDGVVTHRKVGRDIIVTYGVDPNGSAVTNGCDASAMKVTFVNVINATVHVVLGV